MDAYLLIRQLLEREEMLARATIDPASAARVSGFMMARCMVQEAANGAVPDDPSEELRLHPERFDTRPVGEIIAEAENYMEEEG